MSRTGRYFADLENAFGKGMVTSGYRSQEEQDALVRRGATRAKRSAHTYNDGYDFAPSVANSPEEFAARLREKGFTATRFIRESGRGRNQGTGAHWHAEGVRPLGQGPTTPQGVPVNSSQSGQGVAAPEAYLAALESSLAPESKASGAVSTSAPTIFGSDKELQTRGAKVEEALQAQGQGIDVLTQVTDAAQAVQLESMTKQVEDTRAISDEIVAGTQELKRQVTPVFQARGRIADQLDRLNTMNPLERGIRGIFDLNYDQKYLERQLKHYDTTLQMRANDFDYIGKLHETALGEIERRYSLDNALPQLAVKQTEEDLGIVGMRIQQTAGMLGSLKDMVSGETQLISAKALARDDMLSRLDGPTVLDLANQAKSNNGVVSYNGVQFAYHELRERLESDEDQELNREAHRMAIASGRMDMAEKYATNLARSLTRPQVEAAIANGGVYQGIQLPQDVLQNVYQNHIGTARLQAETIQSTMPASVALRTAADQLLYMRNIQLRTKGMFGGAGIPGIANDLNQGSALVEQLITATKNNAPPEVITALVQQVAAQAKVLDSRLDQQLLRQAGGDKTTAGYMKSFVNGTPMDSGSSIAAITHFAMKGATPEGIAMSEEAKLVFKKAQGLVQEIRAKNPKIGADSLRQQVAQGLGEYAARTVGQARLERVTRDLPRVAQLADSPFAKIPQSAWAQARANAANEATANLAKTIGTNVAAVQTMRRTGKPLDSTPESAALFKAFKSNIGLYNATEQSALVKEIDELSPVVPGRRNSSVMIDLLQSPKMHSIASDYTNATGSASFGDFMVNPITAGSLESMVGREGAGFAEAQAESTRATRQTAREVATSYGRNPYMRALVILGGIEGVGAPGQKKLAPFIRKVVTETEATVRPGFGDTTSSFSADQDARVLAALQATKFDDPEAEAYRKTAIRGWTSVAPQADGFFTSALKLITGQDD